MENYPKLTDEIVTTTYEEVIHNKLFFFYHFSFLLNRSLNYLSLCRKVQLL